MQHTTTGRADYFGPLVNRAARFCHAASHGGQITAPLEVVQKVIAELIGKACPRLEDKPADHPFQLEQPDLMDIHEDYQVSFLT